MKVIFIIIFCLLSGLALSQSPAYAWSDRIGADSTDAPNALTTDAVGNVYTTGVCSGTVDFDPGPGTYTLTPAGGTVNPWAANIYITKMDASGNLLWAKRMGDTISFFYANGGLSINVDGSGRVYVMGYFMGTVDFDPGPGIYNLTNANLNQVAGIFILKLDVSGNFIWAKQLTGSYDNGFAIGMVLDPNNNLCLNGWFRGTIDMDPGTGVFNFTSPPNLYSTFILKLDGAGNFIFAKQFLVNTGINIFGIMASGIAPDNSGNIYTTGGFGGTCDFDPGPGTYSLTAPTGSMSTYVLKLDPAGNFVWAAQLAVNGGVERSAVVVGGNYVYITGVFRGTGDFDPGPGIYTLTATGSNTNISLQQNQFVLKLDLAGNFVWAKQLASTIISYGSSIALDAASSVYATGSFEGSADFDPGPGTFNIASNGGFDGFIMKLDASGNFVWAETIGGVSDDWLGPVSIGANADIYLAGSFESTADFDPGTGISTLSSAGKDDIFIAKWTQCSATAAPSDLTPSQNKVICENTAGSLFAYAVNPVGWYASSTSTLSLGTGTNYITAPLAIGDYTYYAADPICNSAGRTAVTLTVDACTAIRSITGSGTNFLNAYPVPSEDGLVTLSIRNFANDMNFEIYNSLGELIYQQKLLKEITELDLSYRPPGVYIIKLLSNNRQVANRKIVRQ